MGNLRIKSTRGAVGHHFTEINRHGFVSQGFSGSVRWNEVLDIVSNPTIITSVPEV